MNPEYVIDWTISRYVLTFVMLKCSIEVKCKFFNHNLYDQNLEWASTYDINFFCFFNH